MFSDDMPKDWVPPEPAEVGSPRWLDEMAFSFMVDAFDGLPAWSGVFKLPNVQVAGVSYQMGYFLLLRDSAGANYRRVDDITDVPATPKFSDGDGQ